LSLAQQTVFNAKDIVAEIKWKHRPSIVIYQP
jgi:hypothetical protein